MKRNQAFTLIELLVVIAIIAILAAILFPVFAQAKRAAKTASAISSVKQQALAIHMYANDNDDMTPQPYYGTWYGDWDDFHTWVTTTYPYVKSGQIYNDPILATPFTATAPGIGAFNWTGYSSLAANEVGFFAWWQWDGTQWNWHPGRMISAQEDLAERAAIMTNRDPRGDDWGVFIFSNWNASRPHPSDVADVNYFWNNTAYVAAKYHGDKLPVGYGDGHAKTVPSGFAFKPDATYDDWAASRDANDEWSRFWGTDQQSGTQ